MAKINPLFVLVGLLVVAFVILVLFSGPKYVPYESKQTNYARYEPMHTLENHSIADFHLTQNKTDKKEGFESIENEPKSVKYSVLRDFEIIDKFSQVVTNGIDGVNGCVSSGLSNSKGYICLTPELITLLKTRGGNASGTFK